MRVDDLGAGDGVFVGGGEEESDFVRSVVIVEDVSVVADPHAVPFAAWLGSVVVGAATLSGLVVAFLSSGFVKD